MPRWPRHSTWALRIIAAAGALVLACSDQPTRPKASRDTTAPNLTGVAAVDMSTVALTFSEPVDPTTAGDRDRFEVFEAEAPARAVASKWNAVSGAVVTLRLQHDLTVGTRYSVRAQQVKDLAGNAMRGPQTASLTIRIPLPPRPADPTPTGPIVRIADIHANLPDFLQRVITVRGQVFVPALEQDGVATGYIQDASGRGINVYGAAAIDARLQDPSNVVQVTGRVDTIGSTVQITALSRLTLLTRGNPPLRPLRVSVGVAAQSRWEGTFIEVLGDVTAKSDVGAPPVAIDYTLSDVSGSLVVRAPVLVGARELQVGATGVTARGAGHSVAGIHQLVIGRATDLYDATSGPILVSVAGSGPTTVEATFHVPIEVASGSTPDHYALFDAAAPGTSLAVRSVSVAGAVARLRLEAPLVESHPYRLRVQDVRDLAGIPMSAAQAVSFAADFFVLDPVVQDGALRWRTRIPARSTVRYGFVRGSWDHMAYPRAAGREDRAFASQHAVPLLDLQPGRHIHFQSVNETLDGRTTYSEEDSFIATNAVAGNLLTSTMIHIGFGDSHVLHMPTTGRWAMIDAGDAGLAVGSYLQTHPIGTPYAIFATHVHLDHMGGLAGTAGVLDTHPPRYFLDSPRKTWTRSVYDVLLNWLASHHATERVVLQRGWTSDSTVALQWDPEVHITVLSSGTPPGLGQTSDDNTDINNDSIVLQIQYGQVKFVIGGDAEQASEISMLNSYPQSKLEVVYYKVHHHGLPDATSQAWVDALRPRIAFIPNTQFSFSGPIEGAIATSTNRLRAIGAHVYVVDDAPALDHPRSEGKQFNTTFATDGSSYEVRLEWATQPIRPKPSTDECARLSSRAREAVTRH